MKRGLTILLVLMFLPLISSIQLEMDSDFSQGETLTAKLSGIVLRPITLEDITFYRGHVKIPVTTSITELDGEYYITSQLLGKETGSYSLEINNVLYDKGVDLVEETFTKNFTISNSTADFYINQTSFNNQTEFEVKIQNIDEAPITISIDEQTPSSFVLKSGEIKELTIKTTPDKNATIKTLTIKSSNTEYKILVYLLQEQITLEKKMEFNVKEIKPIIWLSATNQTTRVIYLDNKGDYELKNISLYVSDSLKPYVNLSTTNISVLKLNDSARIELNFTPKDIKYDQKIIGQLTAISLDNSTKVFAYSTIIVNFSKSFVPQNQSAETNQERCAGSSRFICNSTQECKGRLIETQEGNCCEGMCELKKQTDYSSMMKTIGWVPLGLVFLFLIWFFFKKYRGAKKVVDLAKVARAKH